MKGKKGSVTWERVDHDRVRFRWREYVDEAGVRLPKARMRKATVRGLGSDTEVEQLALEIRASLEAHGWWRPGDSEAGQRARGVSNLEKGALAYLEWVAGRSAPTTQAQARTNLRKVMAGIRSVHGVAATDGIAGSLLNAQTLAKVYALWRTEGARGSTIYDRGRYAVDLWAYLRTFPEQWPDVPPIPPQRKTVMPKKPRVSRTLVNPTWAELDALCRHAAHRPGARGLVRRKSQHVDRLFLVLRGTGVRISSALALRVRDVDVEGARLAFDAAWEESNKRHPRWTPVPRWLVGHISGWLAGLDADALILPGRDGQLREDVAAVTLQRIVGAAVDAGEVRPEVVRPPGRGNRRLSNVFRSGIQAQLEDAGAPRAGIDLLVGHMPEHTRERHYADASNRARRAADLVPEPVLVWPSDTPSNVVQLRTTA